MNKMFITFCFYLAFLLLSSCGRADLTDEIREAWLETHDDTQEIPDASDTAEEPDDTSDSAEEPTDISDTAEEPDDTNEDFNENYRVVVQLAWKQGFASLAAAETSEGSAVDLDLHLIKKTSIEAESYGFDIKDGLLGTSYRGESMDDSCLMTLPECERYWRHDDCSFSDRGLESVEEGRTIQWNAKFIFENTWGGSYTNPETIALGPTADNDGNGGFDNEIMDDQYLVVVNYASCMSQYTDGIDRCEPSYTGGDGANEVDGRLTIFVDGEEVPRLAVNERPDDHYYATTKDFKIKPTEWKVLAVIKWDNKLYGPESKPKYYGNAIVTDIAMPDEGIFANPVSYPVCTYDSSDAILIPIWDAEEYKSYIETQNDYGVTLGLCK